MERREFIKTAAKSAIAIASAGVLPTSGQSVSVGSNEYEFIIVGSGAGGGPLAVNLAKAGFSVLLIEAGGDQLPMTAQIPAYHPLASEDPQISWDFMVRHYDQDEAHGKWTKLREKSGILYPRSSVVGGCTAHNAMICLYPDHDDWDRIFELTGKRDSTWKSGYMRKIFTERIENGHYFSDLDRGWHSLEMSDPAQLAFDGALLNILASSFANKSWWLENTGRTTLDRMRDPFGLGRLLDANKMVHVGEEGFLRMPKSTYLGKRFGVFEYVMEAKKNYPNLKVMPHSLVKQVIFEENSDELRAIGVEVLQGENLYHAHKHSKNATVKKQLFLKAQKEVILCGGAFNTPQTLMLSGIGPGDQFDSLNSGAAIKRQPKKLLEGVGRNLQDRYEVTVVTEIGRNIHTLQNCEFSQDFSESTTDKCLKEWMDKSQRASSTYSANGVLASIKMKSDNAQKNKTDLILFGTPGDFRGYYPGYSKDAISHKNRFTWAILKGHSRNRAGRVTLNSNDCRDTPNIHFNYFEGPGAEEDLQAVLEGLDRVRGFNRTAFGHSQDTHLFRESRPGKGEIYPGTELQTDSDLKSWIKKEAWGHHASCTTKMGISPDDGSVVDGDFKVHGTQNLRVVDASVFPEIPGLFIVTPIYMISEKASETIIKKYS